MQKEKIIKIIVHNLKKEGAKKISLFGSYAKNNQNKNSDVDIVVKFAKQKSFLDLVRIERELSLKLGKKIDLLTEEAVHPLLKDEISKNSEVIYG